jgi:hypothetical protein
MTQGWLKCRVFKGMFSDELAVTCGGTSVFVPKENVNAASAEGGAVDGSVHVRFFREGKTVWAILPAESQPIVQIDEADLVPGR